MIFRLCLFISLMTWRSLAFAQNDYEAFAREAQRLAPLQMEKYKSEVMQISLKAEEISKSQSMNNLNNQGNMPSNQLNKIDKSHHNVMVFISFSMPKAILVAYLREANTVHASVVIRGLVNNSFKDTFKKVSELIKESNSGGVELNPVAFDQFHIKRVPAVVVIGNNDCMSKSTCHIDRDYDLISGNIGLEAALKQIRDHGKVATHEAGLALNQLMGGAHG